MRYNGLQQGLRITAAAILRGRVQVEASGLERIPKQGPFIIAARHYHHLYDGAVLYHQIRRPLRIFVALDWAPNMSTRRGMELLCRIAGWPIGLRSRSAVEDRAVFRDSEQTVYLRRALRETVQHLERDEGIVFFPEGEATIDPHVREPRNQPLGAGLCLAIELAQRTHATIPIIPIGLKYRRVGTSFQVQLRCGTPQTHYRKSERDSTMSRLASLIGELSL